MRAQVLAVEAGDEEALRRLEGMGYRAASGRAVWRYRRQMATPPELRSKRTVAFCGIARPAQFFTGLEAAGIRLAASHAFSDHHRFTPSDIELLRELARNCAAEAFVTTAKDAARLSTIKPHLEQIAPVHIAGLQVVLENKPEILAKILEAQTLNI